MKTLIIGGFLGSGKTTTLFQFAKYLVHKSKESNPSVQTPVVILENEISNTGIDQKFLSQSGFLVQELLSGCICCTSSAHLTDTVNLIQKEYCPDWLIIEATGLAYPDAVQKMLEEELNLNAGIMTLLDASRWSRLTNAMPQFAYAQIVHADILLINKTDMVDSARITQILTALEQFQISAHIRNVSMLHMQEETFWDDILKILEANHA